MVEANAQLASAFPHRRRGRIAAWSSAVEGKFSGTNNELFSFSPTVVREEDNDEQPHRRFRAAMTGHDDRSSLAERNVTSSPRAIIPRYGKLLRRR